MEEVVGLRGLLCSVRRVSELSEFCSHRKNRLLLRIIDRGLFGQGLDVMTLRASYLYDVRLDIHECGDTLTMILSFPSKKKNDYSIPFNEYLQSFNGFAFRTYSSTSYF